RVAHHQRGESCVISRRCLVHPGDGLERVVMEALHDFARETGTDSAFVMGPQRHTDGMQSEISAAAFIRDRKTIAADPEFASSYNGEADASGSDNDNAAIASAMRADAGDGCVMNVDDRAKRMRPPFELLQQALAADAGEPDCGMHGSKR